MEVTGKRYKGGSGGLRKLLSTRQGTALVAGVCTLVAAGVLLLAAARYRHSVDATGQPVNVLVASTLIQKGTPGDVVSSQEMFRTQRIVEKQASAGAIADASAIQGKVATTDIRPGQQLTVSEFTGSGGVISELAPNQRAMSVPVNTSQGLTGVLHAGDRVDVYGSFSSTGVKGSSSAASGATVKLLITNVPVLAVNMNASNSIGGNGVNGQSNVVLKINANDAGALAFAANDGGVWLALRGANATGPGQQQATSTLNSLLLGSAAPQSGGK